MENNVDFTSNEAIDAIKLWDKTVELVAFVQKVIPRRLSGKTELLKFYLSNNSGKIIQCVIWGTEEINELEEHICEANILHIDGACSRAPTKEEYNKGNVNYELQLFSTTVINVLGAHNIPEIQEEENEIPDVELCDIIHHENNVIRLYAYIKSKFVSQSFGINRHFGTYGCGSVTDGNFKMEVRIVSFQNTLTCKKCHPVYLTGKVRNQGPRIFLQLNTEADIEVTDAPPLPLKDILMGYRELKRVNDDQMERENPAQRN
ncbi:uncharacterized protein LOC127286101 [Leptopilina boulardi]|uniref:uncharacterized protein LOC127282167 n=1 Tax=Leptopilina boulardi TaxID=63433 RepID=UPI0021F69C80|nr:uncharacterized protein LOC127282167 [Leptopilina boulardi]XP_051168361.1 uncharacterized protein LOC127286101 [Leptopilina boulardi]